MVNHPERYKVADNTGIIEMGHEKELTVKEGTFRSNFVDPFSISLSYLVICICPTISYFNFWYI